MIIEWLAGAFIVLIFVIVGGGCVEEEKTCSCLGTVVVLSMFLGASVAYILIAGGWLK